MTTFEEFECMSEFLPLCKVSTQEVTRSDKRIHTIPVSNFSSSEREFLGTSQYGF